jgi:adenylosuccinate synthase
VQDISAFEPIYEDLPGWSEDISSARVLHDLPDAAQNYVRRIVDACGLPIHHVSVGPERDQAVII